MPKFHVKSEGEGGHVLLIPGLGGLASFWDPVMEGLKAGFHVSACDHPGVGQSEACGTPTIAQIVENVVDWMDAHDIASIHVVGHSTGSLVAQALALDHGSRIRSMVLSSGWARADQRFRDLFALRKRVLQNLGGAAYTALGRLIAYPSDWYGAHLAGTGDVDLAAPSAIDVATTIARIDMLLNYSRRDELGQVAVRTLVIGAEDDYVVPYHHSVELARLVPGATLCKLNGGHFAPVTRTAPYVERLLQFWGE